MFDAAIEILKSILPEPNGFGGDQLESTRAAIRVLEAAGKVDRKAAVAWLDAAHAGCPDYDVKDDIRALLSALPDRDKK